MEQRCHLKVLLSKCDGFIDDDGSGNYMKDGLVSDISIYPSDIESGLIKDFDSIIWFNR
jgi:hypothetical protein